MNDLVSAMNMRDEEIRVILLDVYNGKDKNADYAATVAVAVDCALRLFNVFISLRKQIGFHRGYMDLAVGLNGNPFWTKFGGGLIPLVHTALQAQADYALLMQEKAASPNSTHSDMLISESKLVALEVFVTIAFCLGGHEFMALKSIEIKKRLAPYFMD